MSLPCFSFGIAKIFPSSAFESSIEVQKRLVDMYCGFGPRGGN